MVTFFIFLGDCDDVSYKASKEQEMQIQSMVSFNPQGTIQGTGATTFTDNQKDKAKEIIAQYDMDNFSQEDKLSLRKELHAQGLRAHDMKEMLKELPTTKELAPEPSSVEDIKEANDPKAVLMQLIEQKESGVIEEKDFTSQLAEMKMETIGSVLNLQA